MSSWTAILWLFATCPWVVVSLHNICYIKSKVLKWKQCSLCLTDSFLLENLRYIRWIYSMRHSHSVFICIYVTKEEKNLNLVDKFTNSISICVLNICISKKTSDGKNKSHRIQFDASFPSASMRMSNTLSIIFICLSCFFGILYVFQTGIIIKLSRYVCKSLLICLELVSKHFVSMEFLTDELKIAHLC